MFSKKIFAKPLKLTKNFKLPRKSDAQIVNEEEIQFLTSVLTKHADFVLSHLEPSQLQTLIRAMESISFSKGDEIIRQGDAGDYLYVIKEGNLRFVIDGKDKKGTASKGEVVGELALLYDCPRSATVIADTDSVLYRVSREIFRRIQASFVLQKDDETRNLLKATKLFADLDNDLINELASFLFQKKIKKGDYVCKKNEEVNEVYFIKSGYVTGCNIAMGEKKYPDIKLGPGDNFGERTLILDVPIPGDIQCISDCVVWVLTKERFFRCLKGMDLHAMLDRSLQMKFLVSSSLLFYSIGYNYSTHAKISIL